MKELQPKITILEIRAKNKMTQAEFGDSIGVSAQSVSSWEQDIFSISPKNLIKICRQYGVSSVDLLGA
ncbi:helix-turn-helix domain-containing protein [Streptococcus suis]